MSIDYLEVIAVTPIGTGSRVSIDFIDILDPFDGLFVGNTSQGYLKVLSENRQTDTYPPRPFRVNSGAIHQYIQMGENVRYLSDLTCYDSIPIFDYQNNCRPISIGRIKIEIREFIRIECKIEDILISATLQNADSVHLLNNKNQAICIQNLTAGTKVCCYIDNIGRHLGEVAIGKNLEL